MTETTKSVQVANTTTGRYDVHKPLPYPFHIDAEGNVLRQDFWRGEPERLVGFQEKADVNHVDLRVQDWLATGDEAPEGWHPVFVDADGTMWSHAFPVMSREG